MALIRWDPWRELNRLREEMNRLFEGTEGLPFTGWLRGEAQPSLDVYDAGEEIVVKADLPGFEPKDVDVRVYPDAVVLRGEQKREEEVERPGYFCRERRLGSFYRQVRLPAEVIPEDAKASFRNGVLELRVPKAEEKNGRGYKVSIQES